MSLSLPSLCVDAYMPISQLGYSPRDSCFSVWGLSSSWWWKLRSESSAGPKRELWSIQHGRTIFSLSKGTFHWGTWLPFSWEAALPVASKEQLLIQVSIHIVYFLHMLCQGTTLPGQWEMTLKSLKSRTELWGKIYALVCEKAWSQQRHMRWMRSTQRLGFKENQT